jgi:hypothetical protein
MIVIGLLLLIVAVAFGIDFVWKNNVHIANPTVFGERLGIHSAASLFVVGAVTGAAVLLGVALLLWGVRRKGANALNRRHQRTETRHLREDRDELRSKSEEPHSSEDEQPRSKLDQKDDAEVHPVGWTASGEHRAEPVDTDQPQEAENVPGGSSAN